MKSEDFRVQTENQNLTNFQIYGECKYFKYKIKFYTSRGPVDGKYVIKFLQRNYLIVPDKTMQSCT